MASIRQMSAPGTIKFNIYIFDIRIDWSNEQQYFIMKTKQNLDLKSEMFFFLVWTMHGTISQKT